MRTLGSFNHTGPDEVPIAISLRPEPQKASVGIDPINRRPGSGGHPNRAIPQGTAPLYSLALIQGWAKPADAKRPAACPPFKPSIRTTMVGTAQARLCPAYDLRFFARAKQVSERPCRRSSDTAS